MNTLFLEVSEHYQGERSKVQYQKLLTNTNIILPLTISKTKELIPCSDLKKTTYSKIRQLTTEFIPIINPMGIETIPSKIVIMLKDDISYSMQSIIYCKHDETCQHLLLIRQKSHQLLEHFKGRMTKWTEQVLSQSVFFFVVPKYQKKVIFEQMADYMYFESIFSLYLSGFKKK